MLEVFDARNKEEVAAAMRAVKARKPDAVVVGGDIVYMLAPDKVAQAIRNARLPAIPEGCQAR